MKKTLASLLVLVLLFSLMACGVDTSSKQTDQGSQAPSSDTTDVSPKKPDDGEIVTVVLWGLNPMAVGSGNQELIDAFHDLYPNIKLDPQTTPGTGGYATQDVAKLLAAIAAGTPPDITTLDRFTAAQFAARGALTSLDEYIEASNLNLDQFYDYAVDEITFDNQVWALPTSIDCRLLYWNKDLFAKAGLDPETPPNTWEQLLEYSEILTIKDEQGNFEQIGFIPNYGNSWLYLYGFQNGGKFLSDDGKTALLNAPEIVEALEFMVKGYDILGGAEKVNAYAATFQAEANDPFITGQVAMKIDGNWVLNGIGRFGPDLNFGVALPPTPTGQNKITWSGGWSWAIPRNAKNVKEAFEVIKWLVTDGAKVQEDAIKAYNKEMGRPYVPRLWAYKPVNEQLIRENMEELNKINKNLGEAYRLAVDAMSVSRARPVSPVGEILWVEHTRAIDKAIYHEMTPKEALDAGNKVVQEELDKFWAGVSE